MDKNTRPANSSELSACGDVFDANSVRQDFIQLIAIFDRQLARLTDDDGQTRFHLLRAKAAAERGLKLSSELVGVFHKTVG